MSDTIKLIVEFPKDLVLKGFENRFTEDEKDILIRAIGNGTPFDNIKAEIADIETCERDGYWVMADVWKVLNNIDKKSEE